MSAAADGVMLFHEAGGAWKLGSDEVLGVQVGATT